MKYKNKSNSSICIEDIVRNQPIITEEEMRNFYTYDEAVAECIRLFDEGMRKIQEEDAQCQNR